MTNSEVFEKMIAVFETVANEAICNFCQEIIWNSPIFESTGGLTACKTCKNSLQENFIRNFKLERALQAFKTDCKYKFDGCKKIANPHDIILHEEDCKFRIVPCPFMFRKCKEKFQFRKLHEHFKSVHEKAYEYFSKKVGQYRVNRVLYGNFDIKSQYFDEKSHRLAGLFTYNKSFFVQMEFCGQKKVALIWVRLLESKYQAKFINYKIEVQGPQYKVSFEGPVRSIDEKTQDIFMSQIGLVIPFAVLKKCL